MLRSEKAEFLPQFLSYIETEQVKDAFCYLLGCAAALESFHCSWNWNEEGKREIILRDDTGKRIFALIVNKRWLLFYFLGQAVSSGLYSLPSIQAEFDFVDRNSKEEWTVRLRSINDVQRLWRLLSLR